MKKTTALCIGTLATAALVLFSLSAGNRLFPTIVSAQDQTEKRVVQPIPTAQAKPFLPEQSFQFPGKVKAAHRTELSFQIAGQIEQLDILEGQQVEKGDLLACLERKKHIYAIRAAKAKHQASNQNFLRASQLFKKKVMSKAQFDTTQSLRDIASAELDIKEKALTDTRLTAPFDGLVTKRYVEKKEHVDKGEPVLLLQSLAGIEVEVQLPEQLVALGGVEILDQLQVCFDANPQLEFAAEAMELSLESSQDTRTYTLVIDLPSPTGMYILPGMTATVSGVINQSAKTTVGNSSVLVPVESVFFDPNTVPYVWIIDPQTQKAEKRMISIGGMHGDSIEVTRGINADERVATAGLGSLDEGQPVRPMHQGKEGLEG